jgi:hypothetical protein
MYEIYSKRIINKEKIYGILKESYPAELEIGADKSIQHFSHDCDEDIERCFK